MKRVVIKGLGMFLFLVAFMFLAQMVHAQMMGQQRMMGMPGQKEGMEHKMGMGMPGYGGGYGEGPFDIDMLKDQLKLNDDQVAKLKKIRSDYQKEMIKRKANLHVAMLELWEIIDAKNLDMAKAEKKVKEQEAMQADLMLYRLKALQETRKFLTDEQYEQFRELGFRAMRHMMGRHGMTGGGMGGMGGDMMGSTPEDEE